MPRSFGALGRVKIVRPRRLPDGPGSPVDLKWRALPLASRFYVAAVIAGGAAGLVTFFPRTFPDPVLFGLLLMTACLTSAWKVNLPIPLASSATLSVSYAACLMSLLLLGPQHALVIAAAGVWTQCTYNVKQPYPLYRTVFSAAAVIVTMVATSLAFVWLGGETAPFDSFGSARPIVGAIATYFIVNTTLIAGVISLSAGRPFLITWREDFLWLGASFMVAGGAGAVAALVVAHGQHWRAVLLIAPIYLTYRTYRLFAGRLDDQKRHMEEVHRLHEETVAALAQARDAERALGAEKERLARALADMTRLEQAREQLLEREQAARAGAEEANRLKDQFLAIVSHELRTPLNAILGWADMLRRGTLEEARRDRASRAIYDNARRQAQLIEDLLDVARITSGKLRLERTLVDLNDVVRDALQVVKPGADVKGISVSVDADPSAGLVHGDAARLQQIALNLLSNAVKFTPDGGAVHVRVRGTADAAELVVTDTGQGIQPEFLPSVFEPFRQADGSTTRAHAGLGLGLSIVKNLAEAHGGTVCALSAGQGRGATFVVRLPITSRVAPAISEGRPAVPSRNATDDLASLEGISVLIVDDDDDTREVVAAQLHDRHAVVLAAASAAHAFEMLQREHVDVLLADIGMPDEDGYSLIQRVRAVDAPEVASVPAAALTAFTREHDRQQALRAGFQLHLAKPIDAPTLVAAVTRLRNLSGTGRHRTV